MNNEAITAIVAGVVAIASLIFQRRQIKRRTKKQNSNKQINNHDNDKNTRG